MRVFAPRLLASDPAETDPSVEWRPGWHVVAFGLVLMVVLGVLAGTLVRQVQHELDRLGTSRTDNAYWTLTQLEVEFLELNSEVIRLRAAITAGAPDLPLQTLRRRYDILFSRITTLDESPFYRAALAEAGSLPEAAALATAVRGLATDFDGSDAGLRAALPTIDRVLTGLRPGVREMAVESNLLLARSSAEGRARVSGTLVRLALVTLALLAVLAGLAVGFFRVSQIARSRARDMRRASLRLATIVATAPDGLIVTDGAGRIEKANPAAEDLLGRIAADLVGQDIGTLLTRRDSGVPLALPDPGAGPQRIEVMARRGDGGAFPAELALTRVQADGPGIAVLFLRDISDRVATEDMLRRSRDQAMAGDRAKAHFIAVMSHEMRTPLNAILGLSELLAESPLPAPQLAQVELLDRSGRVLLQHVNDVLDIARLEARGAALATQPFDLVALMHDLVASLHPGAEARGNLLQLELSDDVQGHFQGDAARLRQVLANLLTNAVKYTRNGAVTLTVAAPPGPRPQVEFQIMDTGIGIPPDRIDDVFADFVRLDTPGIIEEGTGLGLGIVRRLVTAMQGDLGVESEPDEGSVFWVRLPLDRAMPPAATAAARTDGLATPGRVLVAEDHPVNRLVLRRMLERDGHAVVEVADGAAAVAAAGAQAFDAILMDIGMPGMDGLAATVAIRAAQGDGTRARIVAVTAHAFPEDRARFLAAGFDEVIVKPVSGAALRRALAGYRANTDRTTGQGATDDFTGLIAAVAPDAARRALDGLATEAAALAEDLRAGRASIAGLHRLAGLAGTCGAGRLAALSRDAEQALRTGLPWDSAAMLAEIASVIAAIADLRWSAPSDPAAADLLHPSRLSG